MRRALCLLIKIISPFSYLVEGWKQVVLVVATLAAQVVLVVATLAVLAYQLLE